MLFDELRTEAAERNEISAPPSWAQGRTVYGGLSAGLLCDAVSRGVDPARRLRYLKVAFLRPLEVEKPFRIGTEHVSEGRTLTVRSGHISQEGTVRVTVQATYVTPLESRVEIETFSPPAIRPIGAEGAIQMRGPHLPAFTRYFDFHVTTDGLPFQGKQVPELGGWMRFDTPPRTFAKSHLVCLIDSWPPASSPCYPDFVPLSSINWGIHFAEPLDGITGEDYLGYLARVNFQKDGYGSSAADIWAPDGRLLAKSFQTFVMFG